MLLLSNFHFKGNIAVNLFFFANDSSKQICSSNGSVLFVNDSVFLNKTKKVSLI